MNSLVISPHADDEVIGCGGILDESFHVYFCGIDDFHVVSKDDRLKEIENVSAFFKYSWSVNESSTVNDYQEKPFIKIFEDLINDKQPDRVFIPYPSYNQDHRTIFNTVLVALRPHDKNHLVKKVLIYEEMDMFQWNMQPYTVNYFVPIDIERKLKAYSLHSSQVRGHRSPDVLRALAVVRGSQIGVDYAEGYIVLRWID